MAIDYGDSRTGVAISDRLGTLCGKAFVIHEKNQRALVEKIALAFTQNGAERLVLGYPKNMDGTKGPRAEKSEALCQLLKARGMDTVLWDERQTTIGAASVLRENGRYGTKARQQIDAVAASLILEGYLRQLTIAPSAESTASGGYFSEMKSKKNPL